MPCRDVLYTSKTMGRQEVEMESDRLIEPLPRVSPRLLEILSGLRRQRDELGSVADELIDLFRAHGVTLPPEGEGEPRVNP